MSAVGELGLLLKPIAQGAEVRYVLPDSGAAAGGLTPGMVITAVDGVSVVGMDVVTLAAKVRGEVGTLRQIEVQGQGTRPVPLSAHQPRVTQPVAAPTALHDQSIRWRTDQSMVLVAYLNPNLESGRELALSLRGLVEGIGWRVGLDVRLLGRWDIPEEYARTRRLACAAASGADPIWLLDVISVGGEASVSGPGYDACVAAPVDRGDTDAALALGVGNGPATWEDRWVTDTAREPLLELVRRDQPKPGLASQCVLAYIGRRRDDPDLARLASLGPSSTTPYAGGERWAYAGGFALYVSDRVYAAGFGRADTQEPYLGDLPFGLLANDGPVSLRRVLEPSGLAWIGDGWTIRVVTTPGEGAVGSELYFEHEPSWMALPEGC